MIGMAFYWVFFASNIWWGGGGGKSLILLYSFILSPFPSDAWTWLKYCVHRPVLYRSTTKGDGGKKLDTFLLYPFIFSISLRRLNMIEVLFADPFYINLQLSYRALNYCKLVEHRGHASRYTVCSNTWWFPSNFLDHWNDHSQIFQWNCWCFHICSWRSFHGCQIVLVCGCASQFHYFPMYQDFARSSHMHRTFCIFRGGGSTPITFSKWCWT